MQGGYYTFQGWLKGVNMPSEGDPGEDGINGFRTGGDAFAFALGYYEGDYKPVNPNVTVSDSRDKLWDNYKDIRGTTDARGLYNGNISWMSTDLPGLGSNRMQAMMYGYDQLHRIVQARSLTEYGPAGYELRNSTTQPYDVDYSYDPNGNLLTLQRLDDQTDIQDDLTYEYYDLTNRLKNVDGSVTENYRYDEIGNLTADVEEGIDSIAWTPYGKVRTVFKNDDSEIHFRYDVSGNRIAKISDADTTTYVRDASGNVTGVYKNNVLAEQSIYGSARLGLMTASSKTGYRTLGGKKYELSNHLGNVLAVVTDNIHLDQDSTWAQVVNVTDYYPFGLAMDDRTVQDSTYRYGFNGKENDSKGEWGSQNHYDYGFRIYNPGIARFLSVDPIAANFPYFSPYQFAGLDPIKYIDLDGLERAYIDPASGYIIPASDFHQHTPPPGVQFLNSGPGKKELDQNMEGLRTIGGFIPGLDWAIDGQDAYNAFSEGNYLLGTLSGLSLIPGADLVTKPMKLALKSAEEVIEVTQKIVKNSAGQDVVRNLVKNEDDLLKIAENAAGGSLDKFTEIKPNWWEGTLPDGAKRRIEWQPGGEAVMGEGPHVKIMDWDSSAGKVRPDGTSKGSWQTKEKYFIEGKENY